MGINQYERKKKKKERRKKEEGYLFLIFLDAIVNAADPSYTPPKTILDLCTFLTSFILDLHNQNKEFVNEYVEATPSVKYGGWHCFAKKKVSYG